MESLQRHQRSTSGTEARITPATLRAEHRRFRATAGVSRNNQAQGFCPAFLDTATGQVYLSRFANGLPAPVHMIEGLPEEVVVERSAEGRVTAVRATVVCGFVRAARFYTREQAAQLLMLASAGPAPEE